MEEGGLTSPNTCSFGEFWPDILLQGHGSLERRRIALSCLLVLAGGGSIQVSTGLAEKAWHSKEQLFVLETRIVSFGNKRGKIEGADPEEEKHVPRA